MTQISQMLVILLNWSWWEKFDEILVHFPIKFEIRQFEGVELRWAGRQVCEKLAKHVKMSKWLNCGNMI